MSLERQIEMTKDIVTAGTVKYLQPILHESYDVVLRRFIASNTYKLICETETAMWTESPGYLAEWFLEEIGVELDKRKSDIEDNTSFDVMGVPYVDGLM